MLIYNDFVGQKVLLFSNLIKKKKEKIKKHANSDFLENIKFNLIIKIVHFLHAHPHIIIINTIQ